MAKRSILREARPATHLLPVHAKAELEFLDRVFPITKLYRLYRGMATPKSREAFRLLLGKYRNDDVAFDRLDGMVWSCGTFVELTAQLDMKDKSDLAVSLSGQTM